MVQPVNNSSSTLYPVIETEIPPLDPDPRYREIVEIEKELAAYLTSVVDQLDPLEDVADKSVLPNELTSLTKRNPKLKVDVLKRLDEIPTEEAEEKEGTEDEENEDEEVVGDEEDDAGGDYIVSHFDNGEGFEDHDEDGDDVTM